MNAIARARRDIEPIFSHYDAEVDEGKITWCDRNLAEALKKALDMIQALQDQIDQLKQKVGE